MTPRRPANAPPGPGLLRLVELIGTPDDRNHAALRLRDAELTTRWRAARARSAARVADNVAKFGGGSLLTTAVALAIGGKVDWLIALIGCATLLAFVVGTMWAGMLEGRAVDFDIEAERLAAARLEVTRVE